MSKQSDKLMRIADAIADDMVSSKGEFIAWAEDELSEKLTRARDLNGFINFVADTNGNGHLYELHIMVDDKGVYFADETYNEDYFDKGEDFSLEVDDSHALRYDEFPFSKKEFEFWLEKTVENGVKEGGEAWAEGKKTPDERALDNLTVGGGYIEIGDDKIFKANIPTWAIPNLIYGDKDGCTQEDLDTIEKWRNQKHVTNVVVVDGVPEEEFVAHPEFGGGASCTVCYVYFK